MARGTLRHHFDEFVGNAEMVIDSVLTVLLSATIVAAMASAQAALRLRDSLDGGRADLAGAERVARCSDARRRFCTRFAFPFARTFWLLNHSSWSV